MKIKSEEYIFYQGRKFQIEFYYTEKGDIPAKELLESIKQQKVLVKLAAFVKLIADEGTLYDEKKFRIVDRREKVYEFKPAGFRFFNFFFPGKRSSLRMDTQKNLKKWTKRN